MAPQFGSELLLRRTSHEEALAVVGCLSTFEVAAPALVPDELASTVGDFPTQDVRSTPTDDAFRDALGS